MGVKNNRPKVGYLKIVEGSFRQEVDPGTAGSSMRENVNKRIVHEMVYDTLEGTITAVEVKEHEEYGYQLAIHVSDEKEVFKLEFPLASNHADNFLNKSGNIDFSKPVEIKPYDFIPKGEEKRKRGLVILQKGEKVENCWTKENPGKVPELEKKKVKGKEVWDNSSRITFYISDVIPEIQSQL